MPYKRGSIWWITVRGSRQSSGTADYESAKALEHKLNHEAWQADKLGIRFRTWDDACIDWFKRNTHLRALYLSQIYSDWWAPHLSGKQLKEISGDLVRRIIETERPVNSRIPVPANTTGNCYMAFVRKIMRHAQSPIKVSMLPAPEGRNEWLSVEQWHSLDMSDELRQVATFSLSTGLRRGNVIGLQWDWLRGKDDWFLIPPESTKTAKAYSAPLNQTARAVIRERREAAVRHPENVFLLEGKVIYPMLLQRAWSPVEAGVTYHGLRHTYASWMVQAGVPFEIVARLGQWKLRGMIHRYSHFDVESLRSWAVKFDEIIGDQNGDCANSVQRGAN
jgi:integrase